MRFDDPEGKKNRDGVFDFSRSEEEEKVKKKKKMVSPRSLQVRDADSVTTRLSVSHTATPTRCDWPAAATAPA